MKTTIKTTGSKEISYAVTAVSDLTGEEGLPEGGYRPYEIIAFSKTNPVLLTLRHHGYGHRYGEGGIVFLSRFFKMAPGLVELNGQNFPIRTIDRDRIALLGLDGRDLPAYPGGGWVTPRFDARNNSGNTKTNNIITWNPFPTKDTLGNALTKGLYTYNIYKSERGIFGYIGSTKELSFHDDNIEPDLEDTPPVISRRFADSGNYPEVATEEKTEKVKAALSISEHQRALVRQETV